MIKLQIIGNLGHDATVKQLESGKSVIGFSVAHTEKYRKGDQQETKTTWVKCSWFTDRTAIIPYLKKGTKVYVEGKPEIEMYQDKNGGTQCNLKMIVRECELQGNAPEARPTPETMTPYEPDEADYELPF